VTILFNYRHGFASKAQEKKYDNDDCNASGVIVEKNAEKLIFKVRLVEDCDKRGVIYYDNEDHLIFNKQTKKMEKPKKRIIRYMKRGEEGWFEFTNWESYN